MATDLIFNPLLKKNFQEAADTSSLETEIDDLRQKKVTKFFSANDTFEDGEIAQYQGVDDSDNNLLNGFFYKSIYSPITIPSGTSYLEYSAESDTAHLGNINYNGFIVNYGDKLFLIDDDVNVSSFRVSNNWQSSSQERYVYIPYNLNGDVQIGDKAFYWPNGSHCYFSHVFPPPVRLSDGNTLIGPIQGGASNIYNKVSKYLSSNGFYYYVVEYAAYFILLKLNSDLTKVVDWQPIYLNSFTTSAEIVVNIQSLVQTNSQPPTPGITEENGTLKVSMPVEFEDDVTVKGTQTVVTTEQIQSEKDFIKLRHNNPLALASGDVSGISVENYDGNATNCLLAVDKDGWARIGDSTGTLEKIATIEENPTDCDYVQYDAQNKQLKTITNPFPTLNNFELIETLASSNVSTTKQFTIEKGGFFLLIISGNSDNQNNCIARINYPNTSPLNGISCCSATMINGIGVGNMCYLWPGTYTFYLSEAHTPTQSNIYKLTNNIVS